MNLPIAFGMPGWPETFFILVVVVLLFGAKKLPELARGIGKSMGEFKRAREDFEHEIRTAETTIEKEKTEAGKDQAGKDAANKP